MKRLFAILTAVLLAVPAYADMLSTGADSTVVLRSLGKTVATVGAPTISRDSFAIGVCTYDLTLAAGEIGGSNLLCDTTETVGPNLVPDPGLNDAAEWDDSDGNVTHDAAAGTVTWDGGGAGDLLSTDSPFTVGVTYRIAVVVDSMTAGSLEVAEGSGAFQATNPDWTSAGTYVFDRECTDDAQFILSGDATCDAVVSSATSRSVTNPKQNGITVEISRISNQCITSKTVAGTTTVLDASAITYGDAKKLIALHDSDNELAVFYDGAAIYSGTVSDATIVNNKRHYAVGDGTGTFTAERLSLGGDLFDAGAGTFDAGTYSWWAYVTNTIANDSGQLKTTGDGSSTSGGGNYLRDASDLTEDLVVGQLYKFVLESRVAAGDAVIIRLYNTAVTNIVTETETSLTSHTLYFIATTTDGAYIRFNSVDNGDEIWLDNLVFKKVNP